jgi:hypothetical protein
MALSDGDEVALIRDPTAQTLAARGNVLFGILVDAGSDSVVFENGLEASVPGAQLDKIVGENAQQVAVTFTDATSGVNSPEYRATIVRKYTRQPAGTGDALSFTLIRLVSNGQLLEVPSSAVTTLSGQ